MKKHIFVVYSPCVSPPDGLILPGPHPAMNKLCTFGGATLGSYAGWFLGMRFGLGTAIVLSGVAALIGVYAGWKPAQRLR
jgi:hypothetical protein